MWAAIIKQQWQRQAKETLPIMQAEALQAMRGFI